MSPWKPLLGAACLLIASVGFTADPEWGELTVRGLPAGSTASLYLRADVGEDVVRTWRVDEDAGDTDVLPLRRFAPIAAGSGALMVRHPDLGRASMPVAIVGGEVTDLSFDVRRMKLPVDPE